MKSSNQKMKNSKSTGYTTKYDIHIADNGKMQLGGWGSDIKGTWYRGSYRYEI
ncbi:hypothetical protein EZS27_008252 [termite gut metagenome]|uniref:Uncharacterized protein n=1 Tax=termite gut metagenome TaxID=433724 RepID=A0A5J4SDJ6_9ZZZZ